MFNSGVLCARPGKKRRESKERRRICSGEEKWKLEGKEVL